MGHKKKRTKANRDSHHRAPENVPNLRNIYDQRDKLVASNPLAYFNTAVRVFESGRPLSSDDVEVAWLILGHICCIPDLQDHHVLQISRLMAKMKLYQQVVASVNRIVEMDIENCGKQLILNRFVKALCETTIAIVSVGDHVCKMIPPNLFSDLLDVMRSSAVANLKISKDVIQTLVRLEEMVGDGQRQQRPPDEDEHHPSSEACTEDDAIHEILRGEATPTRPPDDIADWKVVPTRESVLNDGQVFIRRNMVRCPYPDLETYKDVQFRLLMEDFMYPLRQGIGTLLTQQLKEASRESASRKNVSELRIYKNARLSKIGDYNHIVPEHHSSWRLCSVQFEPPPRIKWDGSRRLVHGSLVCLWALGTAELVFATVVNSCAENLSRGRVIVALETDELPLNFFKKVPRSRMPVERIRLNACDGVVRVHFQEYAMLESVVFFEPYRAVLKAIQSFDDDNFPMHDYLLGWEKASIPPVYLRKLTTYDLRDATGERTGVSDILALSCWPPAARLGLDSKQHQAIHKALTSRVTVIQGPPGTGKTFIALKILGTLIDNKQVWANSQSSNEEMLSALRSSNSRNSDWRLRNKIFWTKHGSKWSDRRCPIVVICFTNHALDQFLEGALKFTDRIIRLGGQSKSTTLNDYKLNQSKDRAVRMHHTQAYAESSYFYYYYQMKSIRNEFPHLWREIQVRSRNAESGDLKLNDLHDAGVIDSEIHKVFERMQNHLRDPKNGFVQQSKTGDVFKWWLGWDNHRKLIEALHQAQLMTVSSPIVIEAVVKENLDRLTALAHAREDAVAVRDEVVDNDDIEFSDDSSSDEELVEEVDDTEMPKAAANVDKTVVEENDALGRRAPNPEQVDTEDLKRFDFAKYQAQRAPNPELMDTEDWKLFDFAKQQTQRMKSIHDQLLELDLPDRSCIAAEQITTLALKDRWNHFAHWKREYQQILRRRLKGVERKYEAKIEEYNRLKGQAMAALCRTADVIGMTTSGAARNRTLLEAIDSKIVIVEEAAEVLESHIVCSLTSGCEQLIMIGDHQQLRPSVNAHHLATKFELDVSLFERLVAGGMEAVQLGVQHRMRVEVARLIVPAIYPHLENHPTVFDHPNVSGMQHNVFFVHHTQPEMSEGSSYYNVHEVDMALGLAHYLCHVQGVPQEDVTILTTYMAQLHQLARIRTHWKWVAVKNVRMTVVDNFQGEENKIIILSLVRSNLRQSVGFLKIPNRVCVALSRARNGLYLLGNMDLLARASPLWTQLRKILTDNDEIGKGFRLRCDRHHHVTMDVERPNQFPSAPFCWAKCEAPLDCGHTCQAKCHSQGQHATHCSVVIQKTLTCGHSQLVQCNSQDVDCLHPVEIVSENCGHSVKVACHKVQQHCLNVLCQLYVSKTLPCGHIQNLPCATDPQTADCQVMVERILPCSHKITARCGVSLNTDSADPSLLCAEVVRKLLRCGHRKMMKCHQDPLDAGCGVECERQLECGHSFKYTCPAEPVDDYEFLCEEPVVAVVPGCGHRQRRVCSKPLERCQEEVVQVLPCGHSAKTVCWKRHDNIEIVCRESTQKLLDCGHLCECPCSSSIAAIACSTLVDVVIPSCSHVQSVPCAISKDVWRLFRWKCMAETMKDMACGHTMPSPCSVDLDENAVCTQMVSRKHPSCEHEYLVPCHTSRGKMKKCEARCMTVLECGHFCSLRCHRPEKPHLCSDIVSRQLSCGHSQKILCSRAHDQIICAIPVSLKLPCGHTRDTTCGQLSSDLSENYVCRKLVNKTLPCGHCQRVACSLPVTELVCKQSVEQVLGCRHGVTVECGLPLEEKLKVPCQLEIAKTLKCGHEYKMPCSSKDADKPVERLFCREVVSKAIPQCGHTVRAECGKQVSRTDCPSNRCNKVLDCGHPCPLPCREPCKAESCSKLVHLDGFKLTCGHALHAACSLRYADPATIKKEEQKGALKCRSNCVARLECGHQCSAVCGQCQSYQFHSVCKRRCRRPLVCGHKCEAPCTNSCPPCNKPCNYRCIHQECSQLCCDECKPCNKRCEWKCPHSACNHPCASYCQRKPCDEPCPKVLSCGHHCIGLCGETCPPKCPPCSGVKIPGYFKKLRYIYLECHHWVEVGEMDERMYSMETASLTRTVRCPSCPQCGQAVRLCFRYGNLIKSFYGDLTSIKFYYSKDDVRVDEKTKKELAELRPHLTSCGLTEHLDGILSLEAVHRLKRDQRLNLVSKVYLAYRLAVFVSDTKKLYCVVTGNTKFDFTLDPKYVDQLVGKATVISNAMKHDDDAGQRYHLDLLEKLARLETERRIYALSSLVEKSPAAARVNRKQLNDVVGILNSDRKLAEKDQLSIDRLLGRQTDSLTSTLASSAKEEIELVHRLDMSADSWLKCLQPNCANVFNRFRFPTCLECWHVTQTCD